MRRGFTLLETAVVLAITVVGGLLVLPQFATRGDTSGEGDSHAVEHEVPGRAITTILHDARRHAITERQVVTLLIDRQNARVQLDTAGTNGSGLWQSQPLLLAPGESLETGDAPLAFTFYPSGAVIGELIALRHRTGRVLLTIDSGSGEVTHVAR